MAAGTGVTACGSSDSSDTSASGAATSSGASTTAKAPDVAAAKAGVAEFTGKPSAFPVSEPLAKALPPGSKFVFLQSSDPIGALFAQLLKPAVETIGGKFIAINAGATASSLQAATSSAIAQKPAVVLIPAFLPSSFGGKLETLKAGGAKIVGAGMVDWKKYGIDWCVGCEPFNARNGKLMADWVVANKGAKADAAFYSVPEFAFTASSFDAFKARMAELCPECPVRNVPVGVATIGSRAPQTMVNDLQSHSSSNVAVFSTMDMAHGLPAAMKSAGVDVTTIGASPTPQGLQDIKDGKLDAGVAVDLATYVWTMVDAGARLSIGQEPQPSEDGAPIQLLEQKDVTFNTQQGWPGYPDFPKRFATLWHP
jgi:ribose transport system substrate-binding protein